MRLLGFLAMAIMLSLTACTKPQRNLPASVSLPADAVQGAGDPLTMAVTNTASAFGTDRPFAGRPADAAIAIAQMEYIVGSVPSDPRFFSAPVGLAPALTRGRHEWRAILGIPVDASAQSVINSLYAAARPLRSGQRDTAALLLPTGIFTLGGEMTLQRLSALPRMPATNEAALAARQALGQAQSMRPGR